MAKSIILVRAACLRTEQVRVWSHSCHSGMCQDTLFVKHIELLGLVRVKETKHCDSNLSSCADNSAAWSGQLAHNVPNLIQEKAIHKLWPGS